MDGAGQGESPAGAAFSYHRAVAPMLWVLLGLMVVETSVVHLLVALWSPRAALVLSLLSLATIAWFILLHPILPRPSGADRPGCAGLARGQTAQPYHPLAASRGAALIAHPNIVIALDPPAKAGRRTIRYLAHRLDDPAAFIAAFSARPSA